jgi:glycerophosphoryl diester phosphodiesterase
MANPLLDLGARLVIAHRGNRVGAPENTIAALAQAEQLGADALEFDVRTSRDGVPVLMHDATLGRTTSGHGRVDAFTFSDLRTLEASRNVATDATDRVLIPSLEQVLDRFRALPLVIELKDLRAIEPSVQMIRRFNAQDRVVIGSAEPIVMNHLYRTGLDACASMRDAMRMLPAALTGRTPSRPAFRVLSVTPRYRGVLIPVRHLAAAARKVGVATHVWTVNDPKLARRLWTAGICGIITDDPAAILRARAQAFGHGA